MASRREVVILALLPALLTVVPAKFDVYRGEQSVGSAVIRQALEADGSKTFEIRMSLGDANSPTLIVQSSRTSADGSPARRYQEIKSTTTPPQFVILSFSEAKANMIEDIKGVRTLSSYDRPESLPPAANLSEFWFLRDKPVKGDSVEFSDFDFTKREWRMVRTTYLGITRVSGIDMPVNKVMSKTIVDGKERLVTVFSDPEGNPIRMIDTAGFRLERVKITSIK